MNIAVHLKGGKVLHKHVLWIRIKVYWLPYKLTTMCRFKYFSASERGALYRNNVYATVLAVYTLDVQTIV